MVPLTLFFMVTNLFSVYSIVASVLKRTGNFDTILLADGSWFVMQFIILILICYAGASATETALNTKVILNQLVNAYDESDSIRKTMESFSTQIQSRNLNLQTTFFNINWQLLLSVRDLA